MPTVSGPPGFPQPAMKLHSRIEGEGFPLLLVHGLFGMGDNLAMIARALTGRFQVHSLDLRNHGRSPRADSMSFIEMAGDLVEYLDAQDIDRAHILGHSLGGKVAMQLALSSPQRLAKLIVADIAPVTYAQRGHDDIFAGIKAVELSLIRSRIDADKALAQHIDDAGVRQFILKNLYRDGDRGFAWRINVDALFQCYDQLRQAVAGNPFGGDVLFIKGGVSPYIRDEYWPTVQQLFPKAQLQVVDGAGHWLHAEKPTEFNQLVLSFLDA